MAYTITVDVGGTFADVVVCNERGALSIGKASTTPERLFTGVHNALEVVAGDSGISVRRLLEEATVFVYGTTQATNAIIVGKTARTALIVTEGFRDVLVRREGGSLNPFDFSKPYPEPYTPRRLTFEVHERMDSEGNVVVPLDVEQTRGLVRALRNRDIQAVGVCLLWSMVNSAHEETIGQLIEKELPGAPYTLSHRLNPIIREYRRASSTVIDASLKPLMQAHLKELAAELREAGFRGELLAATSFGGVMHFEDVVDRPIYLVRSGPSLAPVAGRTYAQAEAGPPDVIVCDTGGTSFDVSLIRDGLIKYTRETWLGERYSGHLTGLSSVDVRSIGSGGGSIAWIDAGGLLRVGPQSAGAVPGPACYGRGGTEPTVTDAAVVLGFIDPEGFLGGRMALDASAAQTAVHKLASGLGVSLEHAAHVILGVASEHIIEAIKEITVNEGVDPRETLVVAGGGAAGLSIVPIARELGCGRVLVPRTAGALSACGAQYSDIVAEFTRSQFTDSRQFDFPRVNAALEELDATIDRFSRTLAERGLSRFETDYFVEARYAHQVWELELPLAKPRLQSSADLDALIASFHEAHERVFAVKELEQMIEFVYWKTRLTASLGNLGRQLTLVDRGKGHPERVRRVTFPEIGTTDAAVHSGGALAAGQVVVGPAVIEEPTTTIVVYPGSKAVVTSLHNYFLEIEPIEKRTESGLGVGHEAPVAGY